MTHYNLHFKGQDYRCAADESVLNAFHRYGLTIRFSCRKGSCQTCMLRCDEGEIPAAAQRGLTEAQCAQGYFLPCICYPQQDMKISVAKAITDAPSITDASSSFDDAIDPSSSADAELWAALNQNNKLKLILDDFYQRVYQDSRLAPFFQHSTIQRSREKQYLYLRQMFSGERVYFGDRPRNAHHWMVISDDLFDHRQQLMRECLQTHDLAPHLIERWLAFEEQFRAVIVKSQPLPKIVGGIALPLDGFDTLRIEVGTVCDGCAEAIDAGEIVHYHLRLGTTYCPSCSHQTLPQHPCPA